MAVYQFSALSDGQAISFNPTVDRLNFDQTTIAAGDLTLVMEGTSLHVIVKSGPVAGKDVFLSNTSLEQIASGTNFSFADGSLVRIGDNTVATASDNAANVSTGGTGRDLLMGLGGNDTLNGGDNNDSVVGGAGNDAVNGNNGNDWLEGNTGNDALTGSGGQDTFIFREAGAANADTLPDFASNWDRIELDAAGFSAIGATGRFAAGDGRFFAGTGAHDADDRIIYNSATGQIFYDADGNGAGAQQLIATLGAGRGVIATDFNVIGTPGGGGGGNTINGTAGNDTIIGTAAPETINGLGGDDFLDGQGGVDSISGGDGNDTISGGPSRDPDTGALVTDNDTLAGGLGDDIYIVRPGVVILTTDPGGVDWVWAERTNWSLESGIENLRFLATPDFDGVSGNGNDLANIIDPSGVEHGGVYHGFGGNDTLLGAQRDGQYFGDDGNDVLDASFNNGGAQLFGGNGDDTLIYGGTMTGGAGADSFVFLGTDVRLVTDFSSGVDKIHLDARNMSGLGASGNFTAGDARFFAGTTAHDADDRVIFDAATGNLWYDADGNGAGGQMLVADVTGNVAATDIVVDNGTAGNTINGTAGNDTLHGTEGNDTINGLGGNDSLVGHDGSDSLNGGDGNDTLDAWAFGHGDGVADTLDGGLGNDVYMVHDDGDIIVADPGGIDTVRALNTDWTLAADLENLDLEDSVGAAFSGTGNGLNNVIRSASEGGTLQGLGGDDLLIARHVQNTANLEGGDGNDTLDGTGWSTDMDGGAGNDLLLGGGGFGSNMIGGAGADTFAFTNTGSISFIADMASGVDKLQFDGTVFTEIGASGNFTANDPRFFAGVTAHDADDRIIFDATNGRVIYDADGNGSGFGLIIAEVTGNVVATDITVVNGTAGGGTINGTPGNDSLVGTAGNDTINGNAGNDTLRGMAGDDSLDGGSGTDLLDGGLGNDFYVVTTGDSLTDAGGNDTVVALNSWALGSGFENLILATSALDGSGNSGANRIEGNASNNVLRARDGNDTVTGGGGSDFFDFTTAPSAANADTITDFSSVDQLRFEDGAFTAIGATGTWAATDGRFWSSTAGTAHDASDRVVYNTSTGQLFYDADGSGAGAAQLVATLQGAPTVSATDITVI